MHIEKLKWYPRLVEEPNGFHFSLIVFWQRVLSVTNVHREERSNLEHISIIMCSAGTRIASLDSSGTC